MKVFNCENRNLQKNLIHELSMSKNYQYVSITHTDRLVCTITRLMYTQRHPHGPLPLPPMFSGRIAVVELKLLREQCKFTKS